MILSNALICWKGNPPVDGRLLNITMENDLRRWMRLIENYGAGKLYHATTVENALRIIASGEIRATPTHVGHEQGVSLTQSFMFAQYWRDGVVFVFDRAKLHNRLMPIQWRPMHGEDDPGERMPRPRQGRTVLTSARGAATRAHQQRPCPYPSTSRGMAGRHRTGLCQRHHRTPLVCTGWRPFAKTCRASHRKSL